MVVKISKASRKNNFTKLFTLGTKALSNHREGDSAGANLCDAGSCKCYDDSHHIDSELKLEELGDTVIDIASPHDSFDDAGKIVVGQDDVRCLFGYIRASNTLEAETMKNHVFV